VAKTNLPPFSEVNPDACKAIKIYARRSCGSLAANDVSVHPFPDHFKAVEGEKRKKREGENKWKQAVWGGGGERKAPLKEYHLTQIDISTVHTVVAKNLGCEPRRKGYCFNGHEKEETFAYR
jgi:hypothetical protein